MEHIRTATARFQNILWYFQRNGSHDLLQHVLIRYLFRYLKQGLAASSRVYRPIQFSMGSVMKYLTLSIKDASALTPLQLSSKSFVHIPKVS